MMGAVSPARAILGAARGDKVLYHETIAAGRFERDCLMQRRHESCNAGIPCPKIVRTTCRTVHLYDGTAQRVAKEYLLGVIRGPQSADSAGGQNS